MSAYDDPAVFVRGSFAGEPFELLPWQQRMYEGLRFAADGRRLSAGGGRPLGRRVVVIAAIATALATGETVEVLAASEGEAEALMGEARQLLREALL